MPTPIELAKSYGARRTCAVHGCHKTCHMFHPWCAFHARRSREMGSATKPRIQWKRVAYWKKLTDRWLTLQEGHAGIYNAVAVLDDLIASGRPRERSGPHLTTEERVSHHLGRIKLNCVEGRELLVTIMALHALRWAEPEVFENNYKDRHFRVQLAVHVFKLGALTRRKGNPRDKTLRVEGDRDPAKEPLCVKFLLSDILHAHVGNLCKRAAREINKLHPDTLQVSYQVPGSDDPFAPVG